MQNEPHNGTCSFCHTNVPLEACVCTGCGAFWGLSNGKNRLDQIRSFTPKLRIGKVLILIAAGCMLYAYVFVSQNDALGWWAASIVVLLIGAERYFGALQQILIGKKSELSWWRNP